MVVGRLGDHTDLAVIGAGPGGYVAALRAADAGLAVTLVEAGELGGTCLNTGCIPSKTLIEIASVRHRAVTGAEFGLDAKVDVDLDRVNRRLGDVVARLRHGVTSLLDAAGVTVVTGYARFAGNDRLAIETDGDVSHLDFDKVIIATGSRPMELPALPFTQQVLDSTGALSLESLPERMVIVGAGYIGVDLGTAWAKLGVDVTLIDEADDILKSVPAELRQPVRRGLANIGVRVMTGETVTGHSGSGVELSSGRTVPCDVAVVAIGRRPNTDRCSLDLTDVAVAPSGHVLVDTTMRAARGIYAIGDVVAGPALAHVATAQAEVAVDSVLGHPAGFSPAAIPAVIFSDPEIMTVGVTPDDGRQAGMRVDRFPHTASPRAATAGSSSGLTLLVSDHHGTIVGVHAVGPHVSELAGEASLAIEMAATVEDLAHTIHPHPTLSETLVESASMALGKPLHVRR